MKLCMGCMNQIEDHLSACPHCGFNEHTLRQESYYLDPGTVVGGKYIVGRVLNYGGHTVSYLGMDAEKNRKVIVKEYLPSDFSTRSEGEKDVTIYSGDGQVQFEQGLTNFLNEMNHIQSLKEAPGIAKVYDCLAENETGYVVSEYVEGKTLKEILEGGKKYSSEEAVAFIKKILMGLSKVHKEDVVHCDISPETIMVTAEGDIKLMDFGATRYVTTANSKSLSIILKRGYAPEEQYRSKGKRGSWTDVYAVGAVMYRMITGTAPQESVERTLADDLKEPSKMGVSIPKNIENALMNALNVYQDERTQSADVFLKELNSESVKRIKVKQRKNKTGKFPVWAKVLVAGLACVVVAGGAYVVYHMSGQSSDALGSKAIVMQDFRNKTEDDVREYVENLNKEHSGWDIQIDTQDFIFDLNKENGTVYAQSVAPGAVLYDPDKENQEAEIEGLSYDNEGNVNGTISLTLYSQEKMHYSEIQGMNAYALAQKLKIDTADEQYFIEEENEDSNYFDLASMEVAGTLISKDELNKEENRDNVIVYTPDIKIHYYASNFFYWDALPDFKGFGSINNVPSQPVYKYSNKNENEREAVGEKALGDSNLVEKDYFALKSSGLSVGDIADQNIDPGTKYDESRSLGDDRLVIKVIGGIFDYEGKTAQKFLNELAAYGFTKYAPLRTSSGKEGNLSWSVESVKIYDSNESQELEFFRPKDDAGGQVMVYVTVKEPPKQTPKPKEKSTPKPTPKSEPEEAPAPAPAPGGNDSRRAN